MNIRDLWAANRNRITNERKYQLDEAGGKSSSSKRDPSATRVAKVTPALGGNTGSFEESPVDLETVYQAYSSDGYIRRAIDTVSTLMLKSGYELKGRNADTLNYVKTRLKLMEEATDMSFDDLITELSDNFVLFSNAPIVKARGTENLGGLQATGYYGGEPISGVFPISPRFFQVQRDSLGEIETYQVASDGSETIDLQPENVGHLVYRRPTGMAFGVPFFQNVLDDVLILRNIEENVSQLIYRNLFPLTTYTIGAQKEGYEATDEEIEETALKLSEMRLDEIHVLPERHKIETVNNGNAAMDVSSYLSYFRQRVFTGLGMSESVMGISGSANKSTADNQNSDLNDLVKDFQRRFQSQIQHQLINEILYEGGYDPVLNLDDAVTFNFIEIEQSAKMARENHQINLYNNNAISFDELRENLGYDPSDDLSRFHFMLNTTSNSSSSSAENVVDNLNQPENQHGKQDSPSDKQTKEKKVSKKVLTQEHQLVKFTLLENQKADSNQLESLWISIRDDFNERIAKQNSVESAIGFSLELAREKVTTTILSIASTSLTSNLTLTSSQTYQELKSINNYLRSESEQTVERLFISLKSRLLNLEQKENPSVYTESIFGTFSRRIGDIKEFNTAFGKNLADCINLFDEGHKQVTISINDSDCSKCKTQTLTREDGWFKKVPPYHPNCSCFVS